MTMASFLILTLTFLLSVGISSIIIPAIIRFAFKKQLFDEHDERKIHNGAVPRLGGLAFFPVTIFCMAIIVAVINIVFSPGADPSKHTFIDHFASAEWMLEVGPSLLMGFSAVMILYVVGIIDDVHGLKYRSKFVAQFVAGLLICASGIYINNFHGVFGLYELPVWAGWMLTIFAIMLVTNAINFIDGIDGLASSISSIALIYYAIVFGVTAHMGYVMMLVAILGSIMPFLWYNVFGTAERHNKIFMGDTGSLFLGLVLATVGSVLCMELCDEPGLKPNAFALVFAPLMVPCYDVLRVIIHRVRNHRNPFKPDRNHFHHRLMDSGLGQHAALGAMIAVDLFMIALAVVSSIWLDINLVLAITLSFWYILGLWLARRIKTKNVACSK